MSDGREEREDQERRGAEEERQDHRDELEHFPADQWTPERTDS